MFSHPVYKWMHLDRRTERFLNGEIKRQFFTIICNKIHEHRNSRLLHMKKQAVDKVSQINTFTFPYEFPNVTIKTARSQWLIPVILAVWSQPGQFARPSLKKYPTKKRLAGSVAQVYSACVASKRSKPQFFSPKKGTIWLPLILVYLL